MPGVGKWKRFREDDYMGLNEGDMIEIRYPHGHTTHEIMYLEKAEHVCHNDRWSSSVPYIKVFINGAEAIVYLDQKGLLCRRTEGESIETLKDMAPFTVPEVPETA